MKGGAGHLETALGDCHRRAGPAATLPPTVSGAGRFCLGALFSKYARVSFHGRARGPRARKQASRRARPNGGRPHLACTASVLRTEKDGLLPTKAASAPPVHAES